MEGIKICQGEKPLKGEIKISGSKNASLPIMAATVLEPAEYILHDVPVLRDIKVMQAVLKALGGRIEQKGNSMLIDTRDLNSTEIPDYLMRKMRASILFMGPLLGRFGKVKVSQPGGCSIGPRPIDWHVKGLSQMGANFKESHGFLTGWGGSLKGKEIHLDFPSVGTTENLMLGAAKAQGNTVIRNAAREPEIVDLQNFLNSMGAEIIGAGTDMIKITGKKSLSGTEHTVIPDRIEAGTFLLAGAITKGEVKLLNVIPEHLESVIAKIREAGFEIKEEGETLTILSTGITPNSLDIKTYPYPGFPTDMQPQFMALLSLARGTSVITENIFENRMKHAEELKRLGANIRVEGKTAIIQGVQRLYGAFVESPPALRAGAALVLAGLAAEGETLVADIEHIERGYDNLVGKLKKLGAEVELIKISEEDKNA